MVVTLIICLTVLVVTERYRPFVHRLVALREHRIAETGAPAFPVDLVRMVDACTEGWERDDLVTSILQHFAEARQLVKTDDDAWMAVRSRLTPERPKVIA